MPQIIASSASTQWQPVALSDDEKAAIDKDIHCYPWRQSACIEALKIVQRHRGWVSDEAVNAVAAYLRMSPAQVEGVATFYNLIFRQPVGKKVILLCNSVSCWIMGCDKIQQAITQKLNISLGETTTDGEFTLLPIACLGDCDNGPAMMVNQRHYHQVDETKLQRVLSGELPD